jgi:hypothetical protein
MGLLREGFCGITPGLKLNSPMGLRKPCPMLEVFQELPRSRRRGQVSQSRRRQEKGSSLEIKHPLWNLTRDKKTPEVI